MNFLESGKAVLNKEINALTHLEKSLGGQFNQAANALFLGSGKTVVTGVGKSGHVGRKCAATFSSLGLPSFFIHGLELLHGDLGVISPNDILLIFSYSGQTREIIRVIEALQSKDSTIISITGNPESELAKSSHIHLDIGVREEADFLNLAPTASTTAMMALGDALASAVSQKRGFTQANFSQVHPGGSLGKKLEKK